MITKIIKYCALGVATYMSTYTVSAHENHNPNASSKIKFLQNKGQWLSDVKFKAEIPNGDMFITNNGIYYNYLNRQDLEKMHHLVDEGKSVDDYKVGAYFYKVNFENANPDSKIKYTSGSETKEYYNYIVGNDPSKWVSKVRGYGEVTQIDVYDNIDLKYYSTNETNGFKYDFVVKPGGNVNNISLLFDGVKPTLDKNGALNIDLGFVKITESAPYTYQVVDGKAVEVPSKYKLVGNKLQFDFPNGYNKNLDLIIDPSVIFATYSGGTGSIANYAHSTAYDLSGNTYTAALIQATSTGSTTWPTTPGAYQTTSSVYCVGLHKYSVDGSTLIYGTYFSGTTAAVQPFTVRVNSNNEPVLAGAVTTTSLPVLPTAYDATLGGNQDIYVAKLSADGSALLGSTYLGGSGSECLLGTVTSASYTTLQGANTNPIDIAFDETGNIWVASNTASNDFPVTPNALQATLGGASDMIISKFNPNLSSLLYSTYYGGSGVEGAYTIEFDNDYSVLAIGGMSASTNFPVTPNAIGQTNSGGNDGVIVVINPNNYTRIAASYFGTTGSDDVTKLDFDCGGNIYMCGRNSGGAYPVNANYSNPNGRIFIHKVSSDLSFSHLSTTVGSSTLSQQPMGFMVDICGNIYVNTVYSSGIAGLPTTPDAVDLVPRSFWMIVLEPSLEDLYYATYYGSPSGDHAHPGVHRLDEQGFAYASVCGTSTAFPTTPGSWSPTKMNGGTNDNIVFKFDFEARGAKVTAESPEGGNNNYPHAVRGCKSAFLHFKRSAIDTVPTTIKLRILGDAVNGVDYQFIADSVVIPAFQDSVSLEIKALLRPYTGTRRVIVESFSMCSCNGVNMGDETIMSSDTVLIIDSIYVAMKTPADTTCPGDQFDITGDIDPTLDYTWSPQNLIVNQSGLTVTVNPSVTTRFYLTATQPGAPASCPPRTASYLAFVEPYPVINIPNDHLTICYKDSVSVTMQVTPDNPRYKYEWSPAQYFSEPNQMTTKFLAPIGSYTIYQKVSTPGANCTSVDSMVYVVVPPLKIDGIKPHDTIINLGEKLLLEARDSNYGVLYSWTPTEHITDPLVQYAEVSPKVTTRYYLKVWDKYGCYDTASALVRVGFTPRFFIPNAFSPNADGLNDEFKISNITYEKLVAFRVFNRLGEMVFETTDPNKGWNGTNKNGKDVPSDVYYYHIILNGPTKDTETMEYKGDVTLIR